MAPQWLAFLFLYMKWILLQSLHAQLEQAMTDLGLTDTNNSTVSEMTANITLQENSTKQQVEQLKQKVLQNCCRMHVVNDITREG